MLRKPSSRRHWLFEGTILSVAIACPAIAHAQQDDADVSITQTEAEPGAAQASPALNTGDQIVVTARRREESLSQTPVSVSVLSGDDLQARSINSEADLQAATPGLIVRSTQGSSQFNYAIRGQSIDAFSVSQPGVLTYVNEFQTNALNAGSLYDIGSVQVLKGPQGTLFGRNTTGGAVLFSTAEPEFGGFEGYVRGRVGNLDAWQAEGMLNIPIGDRAAFRVAGIVDQRDGFVRNLVDGERLNNIDRWSTRASLRVEIGDSIETSFVGEYGQSNGNGDVLLAYSSNLPGSIGSDGVPLASNINVFYSPILDTLAGPGAYAALQAAYPGSPDGGYSEYVAIQRALGNRVTYLDADTGLDAESGYIINTTSIDISDNAQIKNIIGYSYNRNFSLFDQDGSPLPFYGYVQTRNEVESFSEELQLSGEAFDGRISYIIGGYYSNEQRTSGQTFNYFDLGPVANPILGPVFGGALPLGNRLEGDFDISSIGGFAQATLEVVDNLNFTAGFRYTEEKNRFTSVSGFTPFFTNGTMESRTDSDPSWSLSLEYRATPSLFLYGTYRGSWRGGGFNYNAPPVNASAELGGNTFDPENIEDVELGIKFDGYLGSVRTRANLAVYRSWVDNIQRIAYLTFPNVGPGAATVNADGARFQGLEADVSFQLTPELLVGGSFNFSDPEYRGGTQQNLFGTIINFTTFSDVTRYSGSGFIDYTTVLPNNAGDLRARLDVYAQSSLYFSNYGLSGAPGTQISPYELVNFRVGIDDIGGSGVSAAFFAKNILDQEYYVGGIGLGTAGGYNLAVPGEPLTYGLDVSIRF
ncbi:MAG: TonB-dependent receptor [Parasphingopyxis sp.]|uniref:TonB-dependent receptor n=1 Tax=Parasphingopyxis sp. TaxID=1920299 RepID=UPI0032ECED23